MSTYTLEELESKDDFEISCLVAKKEGLIVAEIDDSSQIGMTTYYHQLYPSTIWAAKTDELGQQCDSWEQLNYCNSCADMGPIIFSNLITLESPVNEGDSWVIEKYYQEPQRRIILCSHVNPLRAASIVYLLMD